MTDLPRDWILDVHRFWFTELKPEQWFKPDSALDDVIRHRFGDLYRALAAQPFTAENPPAALAQVIVLDQFPRNMFRHSAAAFASDALALRAAQAAIARKFDAALTPGERQFLYMPFQHSEDRAVQARSIDVFGSLGDAEALDFARQHKQIIDRFGRFPHRNTALGRISTPEEEAFLETAPGFG